MVMEKGELKRRVADEYDCDFGLPEIFAVIDEMGKEFREVLKADKHVSQEIRDLVEKWLGEEK